MAKFFSSQNNGVIAVIREDHVALYELTKKIGGDIHKAGVKIFTFCGQQRFDDDSNDKFIFSGTFEDLERFIALGEHELLNYGSKGWSGYVPFSNGYERGSAGEEFMKKELNYRTTFKELLEIFELEIVSAKTN